MEIPCLGVGPPTCSISPPFPNTWPKCNASPARMNFAPVLDTLVFNLSDPAVEEALYGHRQVGAPCRPCRLALIHRGG